MVQPNSLGLCPFLSAGWGLHLPGRACSCWGHPSFLPLRGRGAGGVRASPEPGGWGGGCIPAGLPARPGERDQRAVLGAHGLPTQPCPHPWTGGSQSSPHLWWCGQAPGSLGLCLAPGGPGWGRRDTHRGWPGILSARGTGSWGGSKGLLRPRPAAEVKPPPPCQPGPHLPAGTAPCPPLPPLKGPSAPEKDLGVGDGVSTRWGPPCLTPNTHTPTGTAYLGSGLASGHQAGLGVETGPQVRGVGRKREKERGRGRASMADRS